MSISRKLEIEASTSFLDYLLVAEKMECEGKGYTWSGYFPSVKECAASCKGAAKMFSYDRRENCGSKCDCYCWKNSDDGTCKEGEKDHDNLNLYRLQPGNFFILNLFLFSID